jgi:hypothetical protein
MGAAWTLSRGTSPSAPPPEGSDLEKVLTHRASPEVVARVRERELMALAPDPDHEALKALTIAEAQAEAGREKARAPTP